jgi:replicative DNA helicase
MGKTSFVISLINNIAVEQKVPTAMFELEMPKKKLLRWMLSQRTGIDNTKIKKAELSEDETHKLERAGTEIHQSPLYISDNPNLTISQIRSKSIMLKRKHGVRIIFIDYLQLMRGSGRKNGNRNEEVSEISRGLKNLSTELDIPVVALSQLNRGVEARGGDKRPTLADLRDSGAIEQDADVVMFLHRPIKYGMENFHDGEPTFNRGEVIIEKNRDGGLANDIRLEFIPEKVTWRDIPNQVMDEEYNPNSYIEPDKDAF